MNAPLDHLRAFVAVGHELHFGRAASSLYMSQPALSRQIRSLELELGLQLMTRTTRRVQLTPAGSLLLSGTTRAMNLIQHSIDDARRAARGEAGALRIAFREAASVSLIPEVVKLHRQKYPDVTLVLDDLDDSSQIRELLEGRLDIGLVRTRVMSPEVTCEKILDEPYCIVAPVSHPLADRTSVPLGAVATEPFVMWRRRHNDRPYDEIMNACYAAGFTPRIVQQAEGPFIILSLVAAGLGISILGNSYQPIRPTDVRLVPIEGMVSSLYMARLKTSSGLVDRLLETIREVTDTYVQLTAQRSSLENPVAI
jgi:DNA-binding transcriptional LysR family regulator